MTIEDFQKTLTGTEPEDSFPDKLKSLWHDGKGDWDRAHSIIQTIPDKQASAIHAYLHRKEGDLGNAGYWYSRADRERPTVSLEDEWTALVKETLSGAGD